MKERFIPVITFLLILLTGTYWQAIAQEGVKNDGRFTASLIEPTFFNLVSQTGEAEDPFGLMKDFDLKFQWWTLLGEPMEYYEFRWIGTGQFQIDGRTIRRNELEKYPDLLRRFDNLRPIKINILLAGNFDKPETPLKSVPARLEPFYTGSNYKTRTETEFKYLIDDLHIMRRKSGEWGKEIIGTSPRDWEHFLQYKTFTHKANPTLWGLFNGDGTNGSAELTEQELETRRQQLHELFKVSSEIYAGAWMTLLEWPETEMRAIAEKFERYENGEEDPSPKEIVEQRAAEEARNLKPYTEDDFWSEPEIQAEPDLVPFKVGVDHDYYRRWGIKDNATGKVILAPEYKAVAVVGSLIAVSEDNTEFVESTFMDRPSGTLYKFDGTSLIELRKFHGCTPESDHLKVSNLLKVDKYVDTRRVKYPWSDPSTEYKLEFHYEEQTLDKYGNITGNRTYTTFSWSSRHRIETVY